MNNRKTLYAKPKSLVRELLQKLFLKILLKLFPKNFYSYKNKIRFVMNKCGFYIRFYSAVIYLRIKYPLYFRLPSRQLYAFNILIKLLKILKPKKIDLFLVAGTLLGAIRQESFAGRPSDVDLGIREDQLQKLLDAIPLIKKKSGARSIRFESENKNDQRLQILFSCILVDISIFRKKKANGNEIWIGEISDYKNISKDISFSVNDLENLKPTKLYGRQFLSPGNSKQYLEKKFGKNWKIPDKKQFIWNKEKFKQQSNT